MQGGNKLLLAVLVSEQVDSLSAQFFSSCSAWSMSIYQYSTVCCVGDSRTWRPQPRYLESRITNLLVIWMPAITTVGMRAKSCLKKSYYCTYTVTQVFVTTPRGI